MVTCHLFFVLWLWFCGERGGKPKEDKSPQNLSFFLLFFLLFDKHLLSAMNQALYWAIKEIKTKQKPKTKYLQQDTI